jgi:hypothetical protein
MLNITLHTQIYGKKQINVTSISHQKQTHYYNPMAETNK